jgi:phosphoserine aminotransferase
LQSCPIAPAAPPGLILDDTKSRIRSLLRVPDDYEIWMLQGGASLLGVSLDSSVVLNLIAQRGRPRESGAPIVADYFITGMWSEKAAMEAERLGG